MPEKIYPWRIFCNFENGLCNSDNIHIWNGIIDRFGKVLISSLLYWSLDYKEQKNMIVHKNIIKCFITLKKIGIKIQMLLHQNIHYGFQTTTKLNRNHFFQNENKNVQRRGKLWIITEHDWIVCVMGAGGLTSSSIKGWLIMLNVKAFL